MAVFHCLKTKQLAKPSVSFIKPVLVVIELQAVASCVVLEDIRHFSLNHAKSAVTTIVAKSVLLCSVLKGIPQHVHGILSPNW